MKKVRQVLIMTGGFGTRMSSSVNPYRCKSLIEYKGQTLLGHLLDNLVKAGIDNFIVATNTHSQDACCAIVAGKNITNSNVLIADGKPIVGNTEFNGVPYEVKHLLDDRFLMICGHHVVSVSHIKNMIKFSDEYDNVFTGYKNNQYPMDKEKRIVYDEGVFNYVDLSQDTVPVDHVYVRNPYVLQKDILETIHIDKYKETFSYYLFKNWEQKKGSLGVVMADMPPEFDYDSEYEKTKIYLDTINY